MDSSKKQVSEKGIVTRVVVELVGPFSGLNHVATLPRYFFY